MTDPDAQQPAREATGYSDPEPFSCKAQGQSLEFLPSGADRRARLFELVASAKQSLKVCFYIFVEDEVGTELRDALVVAAQRGVAVTLVVDSFGGSLSDAFIEPLREAGVTYEVFGALWTQRYLIRNHQKMVIVDDARAMFGGFNISDDYFAPPEDNGWNDLGITLEGSAVAGLVEWFDRLQSWNESVDGNFKRIRHAVRHWDWGEGEGLRWLVGGPTRGLSSWAGCVGRDLDDGKRLDMFMAYFSPSNKLLRRIGRIAEAGEARLVMAGKSDNNATIGATRSLYHYLLGKQAEIYEFTPCKLHTKLIVLDDAVYLGSANFDMRSLYLNLEIVLRIEDAALAARMRQVVDEHVAASEEVTGPLYRQWASWHRRLRWWAAWFLVAVLDYTVTRRLNIRG